MAEAKDMRARRAMAMAADLANISDVLEGEWYVGVCPAIGLSLLPLTNILRRALYQ